MILRNCYTEREIIFVLCHCSLSTQVLCHYVLLTFTAESHCHCRDVSGTWFIRISNTIDLVGCSARAR
jgi:hypothetical protein